MAVPTIDMLSIPPKMTPLYACRPHVLPMAMKNAQNKNCLRFQSVCAASDRAKRTGGHSVFVSQNQTCALTFLASGLMDGSRPCGTILAILTLGEL